MFCPTSGSFQPKVLVTWPVALPKPSTIWGAYFFEATLVFKLSFEKEVPFDPFDTHTHTHPYLGWAFRLISPDKNAFFNIPR